MSEVRITIEGPGGTFEAMFEALREFLNQQGCTVVVHGLPHRILYEADKVPMRKLQCEGRKVHLHCTELPWGG